MDNRGIWAAWVLLLGGVGCAMPNAGVVTPGKYQSTLYPLSLTGNGAQPSAGLMPPGWRLDNFYGKELPDTPKKTNAYVSQLEFDWNGDGTYESQVREYAYLLRFENTVTDGVVWLRGVPVSTDLAQMDLTVLMAKFSEGLSGANYETVRLDSASSRTSEERYASTITASAPCKLAGLECITAAIDLANVDQLKLDPEYRSRRLRVLIARTPFKYQPSAVSDHGYPVYLFAGYSGLPANFEAGLPDFLSFLGRISVAGAAGFESAALLPRGTSVPAPSPVAPPTTVTPSATAPLAPPPSPPQLRPSSASFPATGT